MRKIKIKTTRTQAGYQAAIADEPNKRATSTSSAFAAAHNLAVRYFLGHNHFAQLDKAEVEKVIVSQTNGDTYLATYDK